MFCDIGYNQIKDQKEFMIEIIPIICVVLLTFITRVYNLLNIPIFTDEAIYIRWAQIGLADPAHRFIALTDGKQPLLTWLMYPFLKVFSDPLLAGRMVSVLSGMISVVGVYFVSKELFNKKTALASSLIYVFTPFMLIYDRLALMDSLLSCFGIWSLYLATILIRRLRLDTALILGMVIGLGLLTKSSAFYYLLLAPSSLIVFDFRIKNRTRRLIKWLGLFGLSFFIAQIMYNSLRLSPWFYLIRQKNYSFILTLSEFLLSPFALFISNMRGLWEWLSGYLTLPLIIIVIIGGVRALIRKDLKVLYLFLWFFTPFISLASFGKVIFPRFMLFMVIPLLIIAGNTLTLFLNRAKQKIIWGVFVIILVFALPLYNTYLVLYSPSDVIIPQVDRNQLFDDWPSGFGVREVIDYLNEKSKDGKIVIGTEGTFGLFPTVFEIYLGLNRNVEIHGYWPVGEVPSELLAAATQYPTYLIFKEKQEIPSSWPLVLISKYQRGRGNTYLLFYQVLAKNKRK
ncbi:hypothetical protein A2960_00595 [Candidatus Gottesmanbacteria bacterium RIFCSPLOWO2_01_FULL_39_12b]|uniref:Glycosyltransferase RgtA/B/C/D-like domain-containing protein n=1 Tax=Candidatus Gottesmanbacteria bacterium RIFCSPLOWO2_01_FULL_39_12b TaxID=1798388 RepID=A0A1F6APP8_9BACT|nr:MAG: hypothetical protein A2960_00595 [Candidatus Gottesmanbacteria bacterium RIFCSPLOWO2_01_FULL_39_12b]